MSNWRWKALSRKIRRPVFLMPGLEGLRKIRFGIRGKGKRGGGRASYYLMIAEDAAPMLAAYAKKEQEDLSHEQKKVIVALLKEMKNG